MSYSAESYALNPSGALPPASTYPDYDDTNTPPDIAYADLPPTADVSGASAMVNVGAEERAVSGLLGGALITYAAAKQQNFGGVILALAGGYLVYRAATGYCPGYDALRTSTAPIENSDSVTTVIPQGQGIKVEKTVTIDRSADELFDFWRNFENLPRIMVHLESVTVQDSSKSHWVAKAPLGTTVSWDAEIINEKPGEMIAWRSTENADVPNTGSVWFRSAPEGRGTEVKVNLEYNPPAGVLGMAVAKLFGEEPNQQVMEDLRRFKSLMETGEIPTNGGQPLTN